MPVVTRVRRGTSEDRTHEHVVGVCTMDGAFWTQYQVVQGMDRGEAWYTSGGGPMARIRKMASCPHAGCAFGPCLTTAPDHTMRDDLEHLPPCNPAPAGDGGWIARIRRLRRAGRDGGR